MEIFNNPGVLSRGWYQLCKSSAIVKGKAQSIDFFDFKIAVFRSDEGRVSALYAVCPHMGVDLGKGTVVAGHLVCPYHKWKFNDKGTCVQTPKKYPVTKAAVNSFPTCEKYGYIWFFNGEKEDYPFPTLAWPEKDHYVISLPTQNLKCHPHIVGTNNPDFYHLELLHGFSMQDTPKQTVLEHEITYEYEISFRPKNWFDSLFQFFSGKLFRFQIRQHGPAMIIMDISSTNYNFNTLITLSPTKQGNTKAKMILFLPKGSWFHRLLFLNFLKLPWLLASIVQVQTQDLVVYETIEFKLPENEETIVRHKDFIERLGSFHPKRC